jgi:predicted cupin superfamily sugar epimerase
VTPAASRWIDVLGLRPHPEGGHYRETYRADKVLPAGFLPGRREGPRAVSTAIYFLLAAGERSRLHRIASDELWHFYAGTALTLYVLHRHGSLTRFTLGIRVERGEQPQACVPAGCWFGAAVEATDGYALVGCTVAPGFDFADLELAERDALLAGYPQHRAVIERLTPA